MEFWGSGTIKIVENCLKHGLPEPDFIEESGVMKIIFNKERWTEEKLKELGLNERQVKAVSYVKENGRITNKEYRDLTGLSDEGSRIDLRELVKKGLLQIKSRGRNTYYVFKTLGD